MSFLQQLQAKRAALQPTETLVRHADGRMERFGIDKSPTLLAPAAYGFVVDTAPDTIPACVHGDWLHVGSQDAVSADVGQRYGITHVLSVGIDCPIPMPGTMRTMFVPCLDLAETLLSVDVLPLTNAFIDECRKDGGRVLVHCNAGVSRSAAVVIGYLMAVERGLTYDGALDRLRAKRPCCRPNNGFAKQLREMCSREIDD